MLILVFDAFSAGHSSLYGYPRRTTPHLERFAEKATVYHAHYSAGNFTTPGTASLLTGTYPWTHRAFQLSGGVAESLVQQNLFAVLRKEGFGTLGYSTNVWADPFLCQFSQHLDTHLDPGRFCLSDHRLSSGLFARDATLAYLSLDRYVADRWNIAGSPLLSILRALRRDIGQKRLDSRFAGLYPRGLPVSEHWLSFTLEDILEGLQDVICASARPFVAYFHLLPPHDPYRPREEFVGLFDDDWMPVKKPPHFYSQGHTDEEMGRARREYDEFVAYTDAEFGRFYDRLHRCGLLENTHLVVTSDHGEMFERGILQHNTPTLYESVIRIPLLISRPGQTRRVDVHSPTSSVDLLPTLCHALGQPIPEWCEGEILPGFASRPPNPERSIYTVEAKRNARYSPLTKATAALIKGRYKLIHYFGYPGYEDEYELFDLEDDPEELRNVYRPGTAVGAELRSELLEKLRQVNEPYGT